MLTDEPSSTAGPGTTTVKAGRMEASALDFLPDRLETVLEDGEFVLYRSAAAHTTPARSVLVVMPRSEHPRPQAVRMLEHEHSLRGELDPAWALRPLALTTLEGRPALVLEDPGGELLLQRVGTPMDVADVLRVGVGMAAAVRQLHDRGLIHKDIKPSNVMTDWGTDRAWLRGFGIASRVRVRDRCPRGGGGAALYSVQARRTARGLGLGDRDSANFVDAVSTRHTFKTRASTRIA